MRDELSRIVARLAVQNPAAWSGRRLAVVRTSSVSILPGVDARLAAASLVVLGLAALVLLVACSNVGNLLLARATLRQREIATRRALGASAWAIVRQLLLESLFLALAGGACGLVLVAGANAALSRLELPLPIDLALDLAVDGRVLVFTLAVSMLTALLFGLAPALSLVRADLATAMRESAAVTGGRRQRRLAGAFVIAQVALSLVLVVDTAERWPTVDSALVSDGYFETALSAQHPSRVYRGRSAESAVSISRRTASAVAGTLRSARCRCGSCPRRWGSSPRLRRWGVSGEPGAPRGRGRARAGR